MGVYVIHSGGHGNVVVLPDGKEADLDMTNYYALGHADLSSKNICTSGELYNDLIKGDEKGRWMREDGTALKAALAWPWSTS